MKTLTKFGLPVYILAVATFSQGPANADDSTFVNGLPSAQSKCPKGYKWNDKIKKCVLKRRVRGSF